jgi:tRNA nucleotidyltransferase (CCA-adding enzyme)
MASVIGHSEIKAFAEERVNLPRAVAQRHRDQVNALRARLERKIDADPNYGLVKMLHSGSVAKGTALSDVHDLDTAVYVKAVEAPSTSDRQLVPWLADRLYEASTNMGRDQFVENEHSVTVKFKGSGLDVDVVPVLYEGDANDVGYPVRRRDGKRVRTSIPLHLRFIRERKAKYGSGFAELIRLTTGPQLPRDAHARTLREPQSGVRRCCLTLIWRVQQRGARSDGPVPGGQVT